MGWWEVYGLLRVGVSNRLRDWPRRSGRERNHLGESCCFFGLPSMYLTMSEIFSKRRFAWKAPLYHAAKHSPECRTRLLLLYVRTTTAKYFRCTAAPPYQVYTRRLGWWVGGLIGGYEWIGWRLRECLPIVGEVVGVWEWMVWYPDPAGIFFSPLVLLPVAVLRYVNVGFSPVVLQRCTSFTVARRCRPKLHPVCFSIHRNSERWKDASCVLISQPMLPVQIISKVPEFNRGLLSIFREECAVSCLV